MNKLLYLLTLSVIGFSGLLLGMEEQVKPSLKSGEEKEVAQSTFGGEVRNRGATDFKSILDPNLCSDFFIEVMGQDEDGALDPELRGVLEALRGERLSLLRKGMEECYQESWERVFAFLFCLMKRSDIEVPLEVLGHILGCDDDIAWDCICAIGSKAIEPDNEKFLKKLLGRIEWLVKASRFYDLAEWHTAFRRIRLQDAINASVDKSLAPFRADLHRDSIERTERGMQELTDASDSIFGFSRRRRIKRTFICLSVLLGIVAYVYMK